jgi:hypothetical protein
MGKHIQLTAASRPAPSAWSSNPTPPTPNEPDARVPAPLKPKPHLRPGAIAIPEPQPLENVLAVSNTEAPKQATVTSA